MAGDALPVSQLRPPEAQGFAKAAPDTIVSESSPGVLAQQVVAPPAVVPAGGAATGLDAMQQLEAITSGQASMPDDAALQTLMAQAQQEITQADENIFGQAPTVLAAPVVQAPVAPAAPPAPSAMEMLVLQMVEQGKQAAAAQQQQMQMMMQMMQQPVQRSQAELEAERTQSMRAARLNPADARDQLLYDLYHQNHAMAQQLTEVRGTFEQLGQRAQTYTLEQQLSGQVAQAVAQYDVPQETIQAITQQAVGYARNLQPADAVREALRSYMPLIQRLGPKTASLQQPITQAQQQPQAPQQLPAHPLAHLPAFAGKTREEIDSVLQAARTVATQGRGAGRLNTPNLEQLEKMLFRN